MKTGLEVLLESGSARIRGRHIGLLAHPASVNRDLETAACCLREAAGAKSVRLFAPEHGIGASAQDMIAVEEAWDPITGFPVVSLYGDDEASLTPKVSDLEGLDLLLCDLQDVGSRYYTFSATLIRCLAPAAEAGLPVLVLDRPNPLGGVAVEGNRVAPSFFSFVGEIPIPNRHGLTMGEIARAAVSMRGIDVDLEVLPMEGWNRAWYWDETGLPWVLPSPNMPTPETALVYPGACLLEGTNLSEGRGTTRPFEIVGAPWIAARALADSLNALGLEGVLFRPLTFEPAFHKHAGTLCGGVQYHVHDRQAFSPLLAGLALLIEARKQDPDSFRWRRETYEFVSDRLAIDLLAGTDAWRRGIENGATARDLAEEYARSEEEFLEERRSWLIYP